MKLYELLGFAPVVYAGGTSRWSDYFGVELELEDPTVIQNIKWWEVKNDGSLRNGVEYVMRQPTGGANLQAAIDEFYGLNCQFTNGPRTSTHIHVTAGDMTVDNLRAMMMIMYTVEDALFNCIGEARKWSSYAMALSEMPPKRLRPIFNSTNHYSLIQAINPPRNQERYYGLNICCGRHGTVEFRYFPGGPTKEELEQWLDFVASVKKASLSYTVEQLLNLINTSADLEGLVRGIFPRAWADRLLRAVSSEQMLVKYQEIAAIAADADDVERRQRLVFATRPLVKFLTTHVLGKAGSERLAKAVERFPVMGMDDWNIEFGEALNADDKSAAEPKKPKSKSREQYGNLFGEPAEVNPFRFRVPPLEPAPRPARGAILGRVEQAQAAPVPVEANDWVLYDDAHAQQGQELLRDYAAQIARRVR